MDQRMESARLGGPLLSVVYTAVKRVRASQNYAPGDYQLCLVHDGPGWSFPQQGISPNQNPTKAAITALESTTKLSASTAYALTAYGKPTATEHSISLFFVLPIVREAQLQGTPNVSFHNLSEVLWDADGRYNLDHKTRIMLYSLDQWLCERHVIPFVKPDLVFLCSSEGEGTGGLVKAIIENPLYSSKVRPPEDQLVIALNNPVFSMSREHKADTPVAVAKSN